MLTRFPNTVSPSLEKSTNRITDHSQDLLPRPIPQIEKAPDFESEIASFLIQVCEATNWDYGEIWIPSDDFTVLELSPVWHIASDTADSTSLEQFRLCSEGLVLSPDEGLPGRVWTSGKSEWIADATAPSESYWLRNQLASAFNIGAVFGVPIVESGFIQAVLVVFKLRA
jgi:hypothetical protein